MALEIIRIGVPAGLQGMAFSLSNVVVQSSINSFGSSVIVAGNSASNNIENFVYIGMSAFTQACTPSPSQNVGAQNLQACQEHLQSFDGADHFKRHADGLFGLVLRRIAACFLHQRPCCRRSRYASPVLGVHVPFPQRHPRCLCFFPARHGLLLFTTIVMLVGICGVRLLWLLLIFPMHRTLTTIYLCFPLSWTVTSIVLGFIWLYCYRHMLRTNGQQAQNA